MKNIFDKFLFGAVIALLLFLGATIMLLLGLIAPLMFAITFGPLAGIFACIFAVAIVGGISTVIADML